MISARCYIDVAVADKVMIALKGIPAEGRANGRQRDSCQGIISKAIKKLDSKSHRDLQDSSQGRF